MSDDDQLHLQLDNFVPEDHPESMRYSEAACFFEQNFRFLIFLGVVCGALLLTLIIAAAATGPQTMPAHDDDDEASSRVILISVDAFRWKYFTAALNSSTYSFPNIMRLYNSGWAAPLQPIFPSKTFPNHYTIVTGLYSESHGIVSNTMWDPVWQQTFTMSTGANLPQWWGGEPIWVTAERQNVTSGCMFWPGSDAAIDGVRPTYWHKFDGSVPYSDRVANVLGWLDMGEHSPRLITLYFEAVDSAGHNYGPNNIQEIQDAFDEVDQAIGELLDGIDRLGLTSTTNFLLVADHGMAETSPERQINLGDYFDVSTVKFVDMGVFTGLWPINGETNQQLIDRIQPLVLGKNEHMSVFTHESMPERWHWANNRRVAPLNIIADNGWWVHTASSTLTSIGGAHGYDNQEPDMQATIIGKGPAFVDEMTILDSIENINIYELIASLLQISAAPNNGTLDATAAVMHPSEEED